MPVDTYPDPVIVCTLALAPAAKPGDANLNSDVRFQIYVEKELYGTAGEAARTLVEESHSNIFLPAILNRVLDPTTIGTIALELVYGSGYRTFMKRKDGPEVKSYKQLGVCLKIGYGTEGEDVTKLPILMPDDDLYTHLVNMAIDLDMSEPSKQPILYVCTDAPLFMFPTDHKNESSITLNVPTKRGFWTGATYDSNADRERYPTDLPNKAGTVTRKRKKPEEAETKAIEGSNKKPKKDDSSDSDDDEEEKPEKKEEPVKKKPGPKKKATPKKADKEEEPKKSSAKKPKATPKKPTPKNTKVEDVDDEEELKEKTEEPKKKAATKRKSSGSAKGKGKKAA